MIDSRLRLETALAGRYAIDREIGEGGMATVYLARDLKHDRQVAVKVLHPELAASIGTDRFLAEIKTTAKLHHPNILPLFDSGDAGGLLYYVMPLVEGESLRAKMTRDSQLPVDEVLRIGREIGDALDYAHARGIVHRDIKPENILLEHGHALVADFGIARATAAAGAERVTKTGMALGTPAYMSPEQAAGDPDVDGRSDLYALACVLYEMVVGEPPFIGPTVEAILVQRFTKPAPRAGARRTGLPRHVDAALHKAMARDPSERFPTVGEFSAALEQPAATSGAGAKSVAVLPFANMSADAENEYFSDGIAEEIINALAQLPDLHVAARTSAFSFKGKNEDLRRIGDALNVETVLEGSVRKAGNRVRITAQLINVADGYHLWSERYDRELTDIFAIQDEIATAIASRLKVTLAGTGPGQLVQAPTENLQAYECYLKGRLLLRARGRSMFDAVAEFERAIAFDPGYAEAHAGLAYALILLSFWGMVHPGDAGKRASEAARKARELEPSLPEARTVTALVAHCVDMDWRAARAAWQLALPIDPANIDTRVMRAGFDLCYIQGAFDEAITELRATVVADPLSAYARSQLVVALAWSGRYAEAQDEGRRAVELDPDSTYSHWSLLNAFALAGDLDAAKPVADAAIARLGRNPWFLMGLALADRHTTDHLYADAVYSELSARARIGYIQPAVLGQIALAAGHTAEAMRHFENAADIRDPLFLSIAPHWPGLDPIRATQEWRTLMDRIGWTGDRTTL